MVVLKTLRKYGKKPVNVVLLHGGPGAIGDMEPVAKSLADKFGILEPFQTKNNIKDLVSELYIQLSENTNLPVCLVGHSWGAWFAVIFASQFPEIVQKVILISAGAFHDKYTIGLLERRLARLTRQEIDEVEYLIREMSNTEQRDSNSYFKQFGKLMSKADSYNTITEKKLVVNFRYDLFKAVWSEAELLRASGKLLTMAKKIKCKVTAIHGRYDTHPSVGVKEPLSKLIKNFKFIEIDKCGHYPWKETFAKDKFYAILNAEIIS